MALVDILVHLDLTPNCLSRLELAAALARRHGARLTGLYVVTHQHYQSERSGDDERIALLQKQFNSITTENTIDAQWLLVDWSVIGISMTEIINHHAHYADLVVVGQTPPVEERRDVPPELPERVVLGSGRPVLVVPYAGRFSSAGDHVLVAWKAGRESTRAVNDALMLLKQASKVRVLAINSTNSYDDDNEALCANICSHLERHGITTIAERLSSPAVSVGDLLLNHAWENGCDLLVMGAYAHTPQKTLVLGTVARQLLNQMTLPVLMAH
jgi:nucleotide-binding universal stress UspA family protein